MEGQHVQSHDLQTALRFVDRSRRLGDSQPPRTRFTAAGGPPAGLGVISHRTRSGRFFGALIALCFSSLSTGWIPITERKFRNTCAAITGEPGRKKHEPRSNNQQHGQYDQVSVRKLSYSTPPLARAQASQGRSAARKLARTSAPTCTLDSHPAFRNMFEKKSRPEGNKSCGCNIGSPPPKKKERRSKHSLFHGTPQ